MLGPGSRLGPYEVVARVGAGGMGEVYRARDTRLDRTVAVKILPPELSGDEEFRKRFEREARALSALVHPNICTIHDVGRSSDNGVETEYLVMEYLEGETLADRLAVGPLPLDQAIRYGIEIASALEAAHREGIIHRDLKPGNVMLTRGGAKLLDFGLAKWAATPQIVRPRAGRPFDATFEQKEPVTAVGSLLGTIHYMAPEQLQGRMVDSRADLFAFGALLYEMVAGRRAFDGDSTASVIAAILERDPPPIHEKQTIAPPLLDRIVRQCLEKDPELRMQSAHDAAVALRWIDESLEPRSAPHRSARWPLALAALFLLTAIVLGAIALYKPAATPLMVAIPPPPDTAFRFAGDDAGPAVVSPDGRHVVFVAGSKRYPSLWIRALDSSRAKELAGTEGASFPFWSPDSRSIAFFAGEKLKRLEIAGGPPLDLAAAPAGRGGAWSKEGVIAFAPKYDGGLVVIPATGGRVRALTTVDGNQHTTHRWPMFLGDGKRFLFLAAHHDRLRQSSAALYLGDVESNRTRKIMPTEAQAEWIGASLLFVRGGTLFAQRIEDDGTLRDLPRPIAENVFVDSTTWRAAFSSSRTGVLVHHAAATSIGTQLAWFDRSGTLLGRVGERAMIDNVRLSPDDRQVAIDIGDVVRNIWLVDLSSGLRRRLTYTAGTDMIPVWSPDGSRIAFSSSRDNRAFDIYVTNADGSGGEKRLITSNVRKVASDWSPDARHLVFNHREPSSDVWMLPSGGGPARAFVETAADEYSAQFSPDGRWIAYNSHETGRGEIFLTAFPDSGAKWQVSTTGGRVVRWRNDGRELFYLTPDNRLTSVELRIDGSTPEIVRTQALFVANVKGEGLSYDVTGDGQRFLMNTAGDEGLTPLNVTVNWPAVVHADRREP